MRVEAEISARYIVDVTTGSENEAVTSGDVMQAVVDALGYSGIEIDDVTAWEEVS